MKKNKLEKISEIRDLIASQNCKAIILAAGRGSKLDEPAIEIPSCLLEYEGKTILEHQRLQLLSL